MRLPKHIETEIRRELELRPEKHGSAYLREYDAAVANMERFVAEMNYSRYALCRVEDCARRLKNWYDNLLKARIEFVEKNKDA